VPGSSSHASAPPGAPASPPADAGERHGRGEGDGRGGHADADRPAGAGGAGGRADAAELAGAARRTGPGGRAGAGGRVDPGRRSTGSRGLALGLALAATVVAVGASLALGSNTLGLGEVVDGLLHGGDGDAAVIVRDLRVPRTVVGLVAGAALGLAGALMQALTRNPLADPGLLGVEAGAAAAVVTAIAVLGLRTPGAYVGFALVGAAVASIVVYAVGAGTATDLRAGSGPVRLVLAGAAVTAVLTTYVEGVILTEPQAFQTFRAWRFGSIAGRDVGDLAIVGPVLLAGLVLAAVLARHLNALALGEDAGRALGLGVRRTRVLGALAITLLCGGVTALAGPIAFVGLTVPYVARLFVGIDQRWVLATSMPLGAVLVLGADTAGRVVGSPGEISAGIVTAALGGPVFVALVRRGRIPRL
jgi:iron complex transport system permease protein